MSNIVAIVGRPNVGKSTLFNRLIGTRKAIVNEESGVTRDRNYGKSHWNGKEFSVIDTGGYVCNSDDIFEEEINKQVLLALDEADVILFMVDAEIGVTDLDQNFARLLRNIEKPIYLVANKVDNLDRMYEAQEFYRLGIKSDLFCISSVSGSGTGDLLDQVISHFREETVEDSPLRTPMAPTKQPTRVRTIPPRKTAATVGQNPSPSAICPPSVKAVRQKPTPSHTNTWDFQVFFFSSGTGQNS